MNDVVSFDVHVSDLKKEQWKTFSRETSTSWDKTEAYNQVFLRAQSQYFNDVVKARKHVFLNEVYDALGMSRTRLGQVVGWVDSEIISFRPSSANPETGAILLQFNFKGLIYDTFAD